MRDPLILPAAAIGAGILLSHWSPFSIWEAAWPAAVFLGLAIPARTKWLRLTCVLLTLVCVGALTEAWHRSGPPPEIDAGWKETVILSGCAVEPIVLSPGREQFTLEVAPGVRARVTQALDEAPAPRLAYGQIVEIEACDDRALLESRGPSVVASCGIQPCAGFLGNPRGQGGRQKTIVCPTTPDIRSACFSC